MYIDVLGSWDTGGRRLTINSGFSYYPSTPDFAFRVGVSMDEDAEADYWPDCEPSPPSATSKQKGDETQYV
jgi:hypothetical protein